jgi:excisionase family DNA binding protein
MGYTRALVSDVIVSRHVKSCCYEEIELMSIEIDGQVYYGTSEACKNTGISRATLFRWLKAGILEKSYKDRRGWRIFTEEDLNKIRQEAERIEVEYISLSGKK